ncbi:Uma2 family endonuclease [Phycisphaera mikurensis]|uniref:Putative restriction endonuclease domain-containing protein n=1 Tax=Phycisphaera mikurensis (strain NBRC 102666 / KCTC 22515 / FYK2301M01) TaxID=1142394 RepID=I0II25_PHYMF|nr:Uma2 family endonuclease [Phycisphaera mikurensis]MBB6442523.1 Uma2 family endonuclease [Phycisphaera mikurensis]BAM04913.1 hypothetical protein PSMK_27540 [Phycisphaera mikurensis NBRC 102666]
MSALPSSPLVSVEEYLAGEAVAEQKHEYVGGMIYMMAGGRNRHHRIATNAVATLHAGLRGQRCAAFNSDTKVRVRSTPKTRFYYPDAMVVCEPNPEDDVFQDQPVVIVEVLSESTRRVDEGEKRDAYLTIPSLRVLLLVEPERPRVSVDRRGSDGGFERSWREGEDAVVALPELGSELPLRELYAA